MEAQAVAALLREFGPIGLMFVICVWALVKKDAQCTALMRELATLTSEQVKSNERFISILDSIREAIRAGSVR